MSREVVRNMSHHRTHLADVEQTVSAVAFGASYRAPVPGTKALCGVEIKDGVVMEEGTPVRCRTCVSLGMTEHVSRHIQSERALLIEFLEWLHEDWARPDLAVDRFLEQRRG